MGGTRGRKQRVRIEATNESQAPIDSAPGAWFMLMLRKAERGETDKDIVYFVFPRALPLTASNSMVTSPEAVVC